MNAQKPILFNASALPDAYPSDNLQASVAALEDKERSL